MGRRCRSSSISPSWRSEAGGFDEDECISWAGDLARDMEFENVQANRSYVAGLAGGV